MRTDTAERCHCGRTRGSSDHCDFCFCEEFEGTCGETFTGSEEN
jgi:hypothetical protein